MGKGAERCGEGGLKFSKLKKKILRGYYLIKTFPVPTRMFSVEEVHIGSAVN